MSKVDLVNASIPNGRTLLHFAVEKGSIKLFDFLLDHGAHPDAVDAKGLRPVDLVTSLDGSSMRSKLLPEKLFCIASKYIVQNGIPYKKLGLPEIMVKKILYHDKKNIANYVQ